MFQDYIEKIAEELKECGKILLNAKRDDSMVDEKAGHANFVTVYDKMIQKRLEKSLVEIIPGAVFVGEEEDIHASIEKGIAFIVDPIDGTTNFMKDYKTSCISVGITKDGKPYAGVVYNPYLDELYTAVENEGAYLNGKQIHVSEKTLKEGVVLFGTAPYYTELHEDTFKNAFSYFKKALDLRRSGSAAIDLCNIAAGRAELFFELRLQPWDYAAACTIIKEAGGVIETMEHTEVTLDKPCSILAGNKVTVTE